MTRLTAALQWFFGRSAPLTFFTLFLFGGAMLLVSTIVGVGFFEFDIPGGARKQVGYIWAFNWSFMYLLGFPIMFFFMLETSDSFRRTLDRLVEHRMILDSTWTPVGIEALAAERAKFWRRSAIAGSVVTVAMVLYCVGEWYFVSGRYLIANTLPINLQDSHWFNELDWSVAALLPGPDKGDATFRTVNALFGFFNYLIVGFYLAIVFTYYAMIVMYADTFRRLSRAEGTGGYRIVPMIGDTDPRRGFSVFERTFKRVLLATLMGFLMCYFMNVQNLFLRSNSPDIWAFLAGDLVNGFSVFLDGDIKAGLGKIADQLFEVEYIFNITSVWAVMMVFGFFAAVALSMAWTLAQTAERSRDDLRAYALNPDNPVERITALPRSEIIANLERWDPENRTGMVIWPFGWPALRQLMVFLAFGGICLVLYKIGLFFAGAAIAWTTLRAVGVFKRES